jgi:hypothetical protein
MANTKITSNVIADGAITESKLASGVGGVAGIVSSADATAITIDSSERVGIGVSPSYKLHISGISGSNILRVQDTGNNAGIGIGADATNGAEINYGGVDTLRFVNVSTERLRITSTGNVGIGTSSPATKLHIVDTNPKITLTRTSDFYYGELSSDGFSAFTNTNSSAPIIFNTGTSEKMRIDSDGRVGIGTTSPDSTAKLHIKSNSEGTSGDAVVIIEADQDNNDENDNPRLEFWQDGRAVKARLGYDDNDFQIFNEYSGGELELGTDNTLRMTIAVNGSIGAPSGTNIYNASDERLKQNISTLSNSLDVINALNPVQYNWIDNFEQSENGKTLYGFVAQEVQDVFPDAVENFGNNVEVDGTVVENPLTVRDKFFIPVLVKAIQEQQALIEAQATTITDLTTRIETLENA